MIFEFYYITHKYNKIVKIFKTISDGSIVTSLQARAIAQQEATLSLESDIAALMEYETVCSTGAIPTTAEFNVIFQNASASAREYAIQMRGAAGSTETYRLQQMETNTVLQSTGVASRAASIGVKALNMAFNIGILLLVSEGLKLIVKGIDDIVHHSEKLIEKGKDAKSAITNIESDFKNLSSNTNDLKERFVELSKEVDNLGNVNQNRGELSVEDYEEFLDISNQLAELFPDLVSSWDENGNAILKLSGNVDKVNESLKYQLELQKKIADQEILDKLPDYYSGAVEELKQSKKELEEAKYHKENENTDGEITSHKALLGDKHSVDATGAAYNNSDFQKYLQEYLRNAGLKYNVDDSLNGLFIGGVKEEDVQAVKEEIKNAYQEFYNTSDEQINLLNEKLKNKTSELNPIISKWLSTNDLFENFPDELKQATENLLLNGDWFNILPEDIDINNFDQVTAWLEKNYVDSIQKLSDDEKSLLTKLFTPDIDEMSFSDIESSFSALYKKLGQDSETLDDFKIRLGFDFSEDIGNVKNILKDEFDDKVSELSLGDIKIASSLEVPEGTLLSWDELKTKIDEVKNVSYSSIKSFDEAWNQLDVEANDSKSIYKDVKKSIIELADAGLLTVDSLKKIDGASEYFENFGLNIDNVTQKINSLSSSVTQLNGMSNGISGLSDNLSTKMESPDEAISVNILDGMEESLKACEEEWENYITVVGDASSTYEEVKEATDKLATAYVNSNSFLSNLTDANKDYYISQLEAMGVANASEVVNNRLAHSYDIVHANALALKNEENDMSGVGRVLSIVQDGVTAASMNSAMAFMEEKGYSEETKVAMLDLIATEEIFNNTSLNVDQKIDALYQMMYAAYDAKTAMEFLNQTQVSNEGAIYSAGTVNEQQAFKNELERKGKTETAITPKKDKTSTSGNHSSGNSGGGGSGSSAATKEFSEDLDWIEIKIEAVKEKAEDAIDAIDNKLTLKSANKAITTAIDKTNDYVNTLKKAKDKYNEYFNNVDLDGSYKTLIKEGKLDIQTITDENLKKKIDEAQKYYEKIKKCDDALKDQKKQLKELNLMKLDKIIEFYDKTEDYYESIKSSEESRIQFKIDAGIVVKEHDYDESIKVAKKLEKKSFEELKKYRKQLNKQKKDKDNPLTGSDLKEREKQLEELYKDYYEAKSSRIELQEKQWQLALDRLENQMKEIEANANKWQSNIDLKEAQGKEISKNDYTKQIKNTKKQNTNLEDRNKILKEQQKNVKKNSEKWWELQEQINDNNDAIQKNLISLEEYNDAIENIKLDRLERQLGLLEKIHNVYDSILSFREAQGKDRTYEEYLTKIKNNRDEIRKLDSEIKELNKQITDEDPSNTVKINELRTRLAEKQSSVWGLKAENETLYKDALTSEEITVLNKISDQLNDMNKKLKEQQELEEAEYDLQKAQNQRTQLSLTSEGFKYQADQDAIKEAQDKLDEIRFQRALDKLDEIKEAIEEIVDNSTLYDDNGKYIGISKSVINSINSLIQPIMGSNMYPEELKNELQDSISKMLNTKIEDETNNNIKSEYELSSSINQNTTSITNNTSALKSLNENITAMLSISDSLTTPLISTFDIADIFKKNIVNTIKSNDERTIVTIGDIVLKTATESAESFANELIKQLPNVVTKKLNKKK